MAMMFLYNQLQGASILTVATTEDDEVVSYRVHYKEWSSRFDEWVHPSRVLEMNDVNLELQQRQSLQPCAKNLPEYLQTLIASSYIDAEKRLRSFAYQPDFNSILKTSQSATMEEIALAEMKAAILLIEAAMPYGSMKAIWKSDSASTWRRMVRESTTSGNLIGCVVLFENSILKDWIRPNGEHLFASLPRPWKAINESSIASVALRIWTLDNSLKYATTKGNSGGGGEAWDERGDSF
jgi:hypothetical protein